MEFTQLIEENNQIVHWRKNRHPEVMCSHTLPEPGTRNHTNTGLLQQLHTVQEVGSLPDLSRLCDGFLSEVESWEGVHCTSHLTARDTFDGVETFVYVLCTFGEGVEYVCFLFVEFGVGWVAGLRLFDDAVQGHHPGHVRTQLCRLEKYQD